MPLDPDSGVITWQVHLNAGPNVVYQTLSTNEGRASFWAESTTEYEGTIEFCFPNGMRCRGRIIERVPERRFAVEYFGSRVTFTLEPDGAGGTDLTLVDHGSESDDRHETLGGWVSVLLALKATVDFGIDLRNHDKARTWDQGYVDN